MTYVFDHLTGVLRDGVALPVEVGTSQQCGRSHRREPGVNHCNARCRSFIHGGREGLLKWMARARNKAKSTC